MSRMIPTFFTGSFLALFHPLFFHFLIHSWKPEFEGQERWTDILDELTLDRVLRIRFDFQGPFCYRGLLQNPQYSLQQAQLPGDRKYATTHNEFSSIVGLISRTTFGDVSG